MFLRNCVKLLFVFGFLFNMLFVWLRIRIVCFDILLRRWESLVLIERYFCCCCLLFIIVCVKRLRMLNVRLGIE